MHWHFLQEKETFFGRLLISVGVMICNCLTDNSIEVFLSYYGVEKILRASTRRHAMKIKEAKPIYYANRKELVDQMRSLTKQKEEAEKKYSLTGESRFSEEAATLELSLNATTKAFEDNQKVIDSIMEQWCNVSNMETSKQQGEAMKEYAADMGKIMMVFRRLAHGHIVPRTDEKKLMEYDDKMYQMAKNMQLQAMQQRMEAAQAEIDAMETEASAGGGAVTVRVNGKHQIVAVNIQPDACDPDDVEMLQDLIIAAANEAMRSIDEKSQTEMSKVTGSMGLPGGLF